MVLDDAVCDREAEQRSNAEYAHKQRLEKITDETNTAKRRLEELKFTLEEKQKQNQDISEEQLRSKQQLDEKHAEAEKLKEESVSKKEQVELLRQQVEQSEKDIAKVKEQREAMFAELERLKALNEKKHLEQTQQQDELKAMQLKLGDYSAEAQQN